MREKNVELMFDILKTLSGDSIEKGYDKQLTRLFTFLNDKEYLISCYEYLENSDSEDEELISSIRKFIDNDCLDTEILKLLKQSRFGSDLMLINAFFNLYDSSIILEDEKKNYALDFVLKFYMTLKFRCSSSAEIIKLQKMDGFKGIGYFKEIVDLSSSFINLTLGCVGGDGSLEREKVQFRDEFFSDISGPCNKEMLSSLKCFCQIVFSELEKCEEKVWGYEISPSFAYFLKVFWNEILARKSSRIYFDESFVDYPDRIKYLNDKLYNCEENPYLRDEIANRILKIDFNFFDGNNRNRLYMGEGDPFIKWMDIVFDGCSYAEIFNKIDFLERTSKNGQNYGDVNLCNGCDVGINFTDSILDKKITMSSCGKTDLSPKIIDRMKVALGNTFGVEFSEMDIIHKNSHSVFDIYNELDKRFNMKSSSKVLIKANN